MVLAWMDAVMNSREENLVGSYASPA